MGRKTILTVVAVLIASMGALLVFMYVKGVDDRAQATQEPVQVLVATAEIQQGEKASDAISAGKLELQEVPGSTVLAGALAQTETIADSVALSTIYPGEQIVQAKFGTTAAASTSIGIAEKEMAISIQLSDTDRVAGFVSPGSNVAVFVTIEGTARGSTTRLLLKRAVVIGVGATTTSSTTTVEPTGEQTTEAIPTTILTLSLTQKDAQKVIYASKNGILTFGLLTEKSVTALDAGVNAANLFK